jgi:hypothetical protein
MLIDLNKIKSYCQQKDSNCYNCKFITDNNSCSLQDSPYELNVEFIESVYKNEINKDS